MKIILALALTFLGVSCTTYRVHPTRTIYTGSRSSSSSGVSVQSSPADFDHANGIR